MRILFLTNFYQPYGLGGEDQSCQQVVQGLLQRGHTTLVLTSMHGTDNMPVETDGVYRSLYLEMDLVPWRNSLTFFTKRKVREQHNLRCLERVLEQFAPNIIFIWGMWNLPWSLAAFAETKYPDNVVYRFATYWPTLPSQYELYWRAPGRKWYGWLAKKVVGQVALSMLALENQRPLLSYKHAICVSAATRNQLIEAGIPVANARIIHTGLDFKAYLNSDQPQRNHDGSGLNLLYAGRFDSSKGIDTAIYAMAKLVFELGHQEIRLSLAGSGSRDYEFDLHCLVNQAGLADYVSFLGWIPSAKMPDLLQKFDVLLLTSIWAEPFARVVLEGLLSGLVVVATRAGGTPEIVLDGENGLLFAPGDSDDLAQKIIQLIEDPEKRIRLTASGQRTVMERFTMTKMMDEIESFLEEIVSAKKKTSLA